MMLPQVRNNRQEPCLIRRIVYCYKDGQVKIRLLVNLGGLVDSYGI